MGAEPDPPGTGGGRAFAGIGFGPIQACLFLREAWLSGGFSRYAVALRRPEIVAAVRAAGDRVVVNTAAEDGVAAETLSGVEARRLGDPADREALVADLAAAHEVAVAVSGVDDYVSEGLDSIHRLLAAAVRRKAAGGGPKALVYAAENHYDAAGTLERAVLGAVPAAERDACRGAFQTVNTVIGKVSLVIDGADAIRRAGLVAAAPGLERAFLAERRARILIGAVDRRRTSGRAIPGFEERADLTPFDQAKFYGQNSLHAALGYFGLVLGEPSCRASRGFRKSGGSASTRSARSRDRC